MSQEIEAPAGPSERSSSSSAYAAVVLPGLLAAFAVWAAWRSSGNVAYTLLAAAMVLVAAAAYVASRGLRIPNAQVRLLAQLDRPRPSDLQHGGTEIDPRRAHALRVEGKIATGADGDLKDTAACL